MTALAAIRDRLMARRREVLDRYKHTLALVDEELESREIEDVENAGELWDAKVLSRLGDADARTHAEIQDALARLDAGGYGRCVVCHEEIERDRLLAMPEAARCFDCALKLDHARPA